MIRIRRLWPFRSLANFSFTALGLIGVSIFASSYWKERKFANNPLINEAVKVIGGSETAINLLGFPVDMINDMDNTATIDEKEAYYYFAIKGPKSSSKAELNATKMAVGEINKKIQREQDLRARLLSKVQEQQELETLKKTYKKQQLKAAEFSAEVLKNEVNKIESELSAAEFQRLSCMKKYYIPDFQLFNKALRSKTPEEPIPEDQYLYGIDGLAVQLPNKSRVILVPTIRTNASGEEEIVPPTFTEEEKKIYNVDKVNEGFLKQKLVEKIENLSEEELAIYSKHKTSLMYSKHGRIRSVLMLVMGAAAISLYLVVSKNRLRSIAGSLLFVEIKKVLLDSPKMAQVLKQVSISKNSIRLHDVVMGGKKGAHLQCQIDIEGFPGAKIDVHGEIKDENLVKFTKYDLVYRANSQTKRVDLLL